MKTTRLALLTGAFGVLVHEVIYRQTISPGEADYELYGTITHAGVDLVLLTLLIGFALWIQSSAGTRR